MALPWALSLGHSHRRKQNVCRALLSKVIVLLKLHIYNNGAIQPHTNTVEGDRETKSRSRLRYSLAIQAKHRLDYAGMLGWIRCYWGAGVARGGLGGEGRQREVLFTDASQGRWQQTDDKQEEVMIQMATTHQASCIQGCITMLPLVPTFNPLIILGSRECGCPCFPEENSKAKVG